MTPHIHPHAAESPRRQDALDGRAGMSAVAPLGIAVRLRQKMFSGPAEDQRLKLVAAEAADMIEALYAACYAAYQQVDGEQYPDLIGPLHAALLKATEKSA